MTVFGIEMNPMIDSANNQDYITLIDASNTVIFSKKHS